jgi:sterol desaturase/sphingolipid hydroxylase (fatty acid hydroxylase superfamily)
MIDIALDFLSDLLSEVTNPQKRVYIGYLTSALCIAFLWLFFIEKLKIKDAASVIFSKRIWLSKSSLADFKLLLLNRIILSAGAAAVVSQITISTFLYECLHSQNFVQPLMLYSTPASTVAVLFTTCFFLLDDFSRFFVHRLMHKVPLLWSFHQVHHSAKTMTPFTIFRTHPVEGIIFLIRTSLVQGLVISLFIYLFGSKVDLITVFGASVGVVIFHSLGSNLRHSHIKIRYPKFIERVFISPGQHQIHHSVEQQHFDKNFGVALAIWDLMYGSLAFSEKNEHKFGLTNKFGEKQNLLHLFFYPFKSASTTLRLTFKSRGRF